MQHSPSPTEIDEEHPFDTFQDDFDIVVTTAMRLNYMRVVDDKDRLIHPDNPRLVALLRFFPSLQDPISRSFIRLPAPSHLRGALIDIVTVPYVDLERYILSKFAIPPTVFKHALMFSLKRDPTGHGAPDQIHKVRRLLDLAIDATGSAKHGKVLA